LLFGPPLRWPDRPRGAPSRSDVALSLWPTAGSGYHRIAQDTARAVRGARWARATILTVNVQAPPVSSMT
jgi:hypothetical protein